MTLEEWLESNIRYLETAIIELPAKGDLAPLFAALKDDTPMIFGLDFRMFSKDRAVELFQAGLRAIEAEKYAIIAAAWYVAVPADEGDAATRVIDREATGGVYKDQRRECYQVTVGDRERSLIALFDVERDWKGKVRKLIRKNEGTPQAPLLIGRMVDLLVERTVH